MIIKFFKNKNKFLFEKDIDLSDFGFIEKYGEKLTNSSSRLILYTFEYFFNLDVNEYKLDELVTTINNNKLIINIILKEEDFIKMRNDKIDNILKK